MGPGVDIWSFGCVLSEVATWLVGGTKGLEHYRTLRTKSHNVDFRDSDSFHNGLDVLPCVPAHHESLREALQSQGDTITQNILTLIDSYMLKSKDQRRDARDLWMMTFGHESIFARSPNTTEPTEPTEPTDSTDSTDPPSPSRPETSTNSPVIDDKPTFLLEPPRESPSSAVSTSTQESYWATNIDDGRNNRSSIHDGHGNDITSVQYHINTTNDSLPQSDAQLPPISEPTSRSSNPPLPDWPVKRLHEWRQKRASLPKGCWIADLKNRDHVSVQNDFRLWVWLTACRCSSWMIQRR